ncbi:carboxylating nicotinate-nucleotide diphosphorylase [Chloroflexota bacterium]
MGCCDYLSDEEAEEVDKIIDLALAEDTSHGDITSEVLIPPELNGKASILIKEEGILAGGEIARRVFLNVNPALKVETLIEDSSKVQPGDIIATISGRVISILKAERTVLNFLQRLSGIASLTARYVAETGGLTVNIVDTRKTTPGLRVLEKYAVRMGGGKNHRLHMGDGILIKDNHLAALRALGMSLKDITTKANQNAPPGIKVEVEVTTAQEALDAVEAGADMIMLDNMNFDEMKRVVGLVSGQAKIEASGGITLANVRQAAMTGVDIISIGALTHSFKALDISLEIEPQTLELL